MKFSITNFLITMILVIVAIIIAIPSLNINIFGKTLKYDGLNVEGITGGIIKDFGFEPTRDFNEQKVYTLDFKELNSTGSTLEIKEATFKKNFNIIKNRLDIIQMDNYEIKQVKTNDGKYYAEAYFVNDNSEFTNVISSLINKGEIYVFEDDPAYVQSENIDENSNIFLTGKRPSQTLSIQDVARVGHYLDTITTQGGTQSIYVVQLDFGANNTDKVTQAGSYADNSKAFVPGILLIQNGMPLGRQSSAVLPASSGGQSYIKFTSVFGDPKSLVQSRALAGMVTTDAIDTGIEITEERITNSLMDASTIQNFKILLGVMVLVFSVYSIARYKKLGLVVSLAFLSEVLFGYALAKVPDIKLSAGFIFGNIIGLLVILVLLSSFLDKNLNFKNIKERWDKTRKEYWLIVSSFSVLFIIWVFAFQEIEILLSTCIGITVFLYSGALAIEVSLRSLLPLVIKK